MNKKDHEEDLGIKILPKKDAFWERVKKAAEQDMEDARNSILLNEELVKVADQKLSK